MDRWAEYRRTLGGRGEDLAAAFLRRAGMRVLARNWRTPAGEIDIVARDGPVLVVAEVKTRTSVRYGHPVEAITPDKRRRLRRLGRAWAVRHRVPVHPLRVDGVCVLVSGGRVFVSHERGMP
ncbi:MULTISPECIES: YraN family protein [unclassified Nocardiopsis]|uniref:YraN family protein n=1 Tax=unclassified Nocardiopsis TaxID=2649073 RepID=UPI00093CFDB2|nr:YraN family protein [Nocardiopsis sp. TSRI0078]